MRELCGIWVGYALCIGKSTGCVCVILILHPLSCVAIPPALYIFCQGFDFIDSSLIDEERVFAAINVILSFQVRVGGGLTAAAP